MLLFLILLLFLTRGSNSEFSLLCRLSLLLFSFSSSLFFLSLLSFFLLSFFCFFTSRSKAQVFLGPSWLRFVDVGAVLFRVSSGQLTKQGIGLFAPSVPRLTKLIPGQRHAAPSPWALRIWHSPHCLWWNWKHCVWLLVRLCRAADRLDFGDVV